MCSGAKYILRSHQGPSKDKVLTGCISFLPPASRIFPEVSNTELKLNFEAVPGFRTMYHKEHSCVFQDSFKSVEFHKIFLVARLGDLILNAGAFAEEPVTAAEVPGSLQGQLLPRPSSASWATTAFPEWAGEPDPFDRSLGTQRSPVGM